jgi:hypothetical protein
VNIISKTCISGKMPKLCSEGNDVDCGAVTIRKEGEEQGVEGEKGAEPSNTRMMTGLCPCH